MIVISNLHPVGSSFFADAESYLIDLDEAEMRIQGGNSISDLNDAPPYSKYFDTAPSPVPVPVQQPQSANA